MAVKLAGMESALQACEKVKSYVNTGFDITLDTAIDLQEHMPEAGEELANELRTVMADYARVELEMKQLDEAVAWLKQQAGAESDTQEGGDMAALLERRLAEVKQRDRDIDAHHHHKFQELQTKLAATSDMQAGASADDDDDIQLTEAEVNTRCPVTGMDMEVPVQNTLCQHRYDQRGVRQLIKIRKGKARCPVVGCGNTEPIKEAHLREDKEMKRFIERKHRKVAKK